MPGMTPELLKTLAGILLRASDLYHGIDAPLKAAVADYQAAVMASGDLALIHAHMKPDDDFVRDNTGSGIARAYLTRQIQRFGAPIRDLGIAGVTDVRTFAEYYNTGAGGPYQCLLPEGFTALYAMLTSISLRPQDTLPPAGVELSGSSRGRAVDAALYAGCPAPVCTFSGATLSPSRAAGANLLLVRGDARDAAGAVQAERCFSAVVAGNGTFALTPEMPGDLLLSVQEITLPTNMTAGAAYILTAAL